RTVGGHRRIPRVDAIRFVRATRASVVHPEILGLAAGVDPRSVAVADGAEGFADLLVRGAGVQARSLLEAWYLGGESLAAIIDGPLRAALDRVGELWHADRADGIFLEHRALQICVHALSQLSLLVPVAAGAPVAVGGAAAGDPYLLPSMAAALVLAGEGFATVDLGADVPEESLAAATMRLAPRLVWVSVSVSAIGDGRVEETVARLVGAAAEHDAQVMIGGRAVTAMSLRPAANLHRGGSMAELAAFARGMQAGAAS
ncbi:MAG: B12-binding domain-containing protein, partial [Candidatus Binatia bacterium]